MVEYFKRILKVLNRDFDESKVSEHDGIIEIPGDMFTQDLAEFTETLNNFNVRHKLLAWSRLLVDEYIRKQNISLACDKKSYLKLLELIPEEKLRDSVKNSFKNNKFEAKQNEINKTRDTLYKVFEDAINDRYKIDLTKLDLINCTELLRELEYKNKKCTVERLAILEGEYIPTPKNKKRRKKKVEVQESQQVQEVQDQQQTQEQQEIDHSCLGGKL